MQPYVNDQYAPLAHIPELRDRVPNATGTWLDAHDTRRLTAYGVLGAYRNNTRRYHLPQSLWVGKVIDGEVVPGQAEQYREYGDPGLLIDTARALLLGDDQVITFTEPEPAATSADDGDEPVENPNQDFIDWLNTWAVSERLTQKLLEGEEHAIGDGDSVYTLGWSSAKNRPRLRTYDPGFYFPDTQNYARVEGWEDDEYPSTVHIAWEWEDDDGMKWVRRHTWTLRKTVAPYATKYGSTGEWVCLARVVDYNLAHLSENATVYSPELTPKAGRRPHLSPGSDPDGWLNLGIDFIPVIHVPNDPSTQRTFGRALPLRVAQILDDLGNTDTDTAKASQESVPRLLTTGVDAGGVFGAGGQLAMPTGESASYIDTSRNLTALTAYGDRLLDRLATNTRLAQALLGQVRPDDVPSGYALELGFHPARQLLREMRTVRDEKYPLILKFAMRLAQTAGALRAGETPAATLELGASLPADRSAAVDAVKALLGIGGMSTETAVRVLQEAGFPIDDAAEEVERIRAEAFEKAVQLADATGDTAAARAFLGLEPRTVTPTDVE